MKTYNTKGKKEKKIIEGLILIWRDIYFNQMAIEKGLTIEPTSDTLQRSMNNIMQVLAQCDKKKVKKIGKKVSKDTNKLFEDLNNV